MEDRLAWIDLEMTGLNADKDIILEIASIVTDSSLRIVAQGPDLAIHYPPEALEGMDDWSRRHHAASGLLERVARSKTDCREAEEQTLRFLRQHCESGTSPLCGNSVWQDRRFLLRQMPHLERFFHYRLIDVSTIKELARRWYPQLPPFEKRKAHLALSDIRESIQELRYYRDQVFRASC